MKLGIENRKQIVWLAVLGGIALLTLGYEFWPSSTAAPASAPTASTPAKPGMRRTASGKIKVGNAYKRHLLTNKSKRAKRNAKGTVTLQKGDAKLVLTYMPYMRG